MKPKQIKTGGRKKIQTKDLVSIGENNRYKHDKLCCCENCMVEFNKQPEQDAVCTEHGREGCFHELEQKPFDKKEFIKKVKAIRKTDGAVNYASAWKCPLHQCKNCGAVWTVEETEK